jgi:predicted N-formylglutamate amidohydrolase
MTGQSTTLNLPADCLLDGDSAGGFLILCDHASNALPPPYGTLGLPLAELERHIAYDIGAATVARTLAARLRAPAVLAPFSRLLIDPNRGLDDPTLIMTLSDGAVVPGNVGVGAAARTLRIERYYRPYHDAVAQAIDGALARGRPPDIIAIHSFTPFWKTTPRPWHVGVLWEGDRRLPAALIAELAADPALVVGDNEPYAGGLPGDTMDTHAVKRHLRHALIEIRQDLVAVDSDAVEWGERLAHILPKAVARAGSAD